MRVTWSAASEEERKEKQWNERNLESHCVYWILIVILFIFLELFSTNFLSELKEGEVGEEGVGEGPEDEKNTGPHEQQQLAPEQSHQVSVPAGTTTPHL